MNAVLRDLGDRSKQFKQFNPMRGLNFDLWLLHPMLRVCLLSLSKDLKSNDAKDRLAAGLRERLNNSLIFLMKEKADYSQERSKRRVKRSKVIKHFARLRLNLFNSWIPIKRWNTKAEQVWNGMHFFCNLWCWSIIVQASLTQYSQKQLWN